MTTIDVPDAVWSLLAAAAVLLVIVAGFPLLLRGGGRRRGRYGRDVKVRLGPGLPLLALLMAARRLDTVLLAAATAGFIATVVLNARA